MQAPYRRPPTRSWWQRLGCVWVIALGVFVVGYFYNWGTYPTPAQNATVQPPTRVTEMSRTPTREPRSTRTPTATPRTTVFYVDAFAPINVYSCASVTCSIIDTLPPAEEVRVRNVLTGSEINGSRQWYRINHGTDTAFVHSSALIRHVTVTPLPFATNTIIPAASPVTILSPIVIPASVPTSSLTFTDVPTYTLTPSRVPTIALIYVITAPTSANGRSCAQTTCAVVVALPNGAQINVLSTIEGESVNGNALWYRAMYNNNLIYVHSSVASRVSGGSIATLKPTYPTSQPATPRPVQPMQPTSAPTWTRFPTQRPVPTTANSSCPSDPTCGSLSSCDMAYTCLAQGYTGLDRDSDGVPCETLCG